MAFLVWYVMERTSVGYEMRITGENPRFAFFSGLRTDQIVLLSGGRVVEMDSPAELLKKNGLFRHMAQLQSESMEWTA